VPEQLILDLSREPSLAAVDFLPAPVNRDALAWIRRWPDWPGPALVLHGPAGAGKSHLARILAARSGAVFADGRRLPAPEERVHERPLILDPALPLVDEQRLLHLLDRMRLEGGHVLLTARDPVPAWPLRLPDLASRLRAAPSVELGLPDDDLLAALLVKLFDDRQIRVDAGVIAFLVRRIERSYAAAALVVAALDAVSLRDGRRVSLPMARALLATGSRDNEGWRDDNGSRDQG
jgi:chromosomal replication initiation ATPase DnaA